MPDEQTTPPGGNPDPELTPGRGVPLIPGPPLSVRPPISARRLNTLFLLRGIVWLIVIAGVIVVIVIALRHFL
jgi:hypothetical protein